MHQLKYYLAFLFTAFSVLTLSGCTDNNKAGDVAIAFTEAMIAGDAEKCFLHIYLDEAGDAQAEFVKGKVGTIVTASAKKIELEGGVKDVKLVDVVDDKNDSRRKHVRVEIIRNNGKTKVENYRLIKDKNGDFKIVL